MDRYRLKNIMIIILLLVNGFLLGVLSMRQTSVNASHRQKAQQLVELFAAYADDTFGWAKEIWDVSTIGVLMNPDWSRSTVEPSPILSLDTQTYARHAGRHPFRIVSALDRNAMFRDMYRKLAKA